MSWRPEKWEEEAARWHTQQCLPGECLCLAREDGADAILDALKKQGKVCNPLECRGSDGFSCISCMEYVTQKRRGWLVFIPEEGL